MRIGFVLCEHPLDIRIRKEARSLAAAGHEVVGLLREQQSNQRLYELDAITVQSYPPPRETEMSKALTFVRRMSFLSIPVEERIERFALEHRVDVLHIHDLPNVGPGIRAARKLRLPIVADLHENFPAAVRAWTSRPKPHHWITTNPTIWHNYQKRCVRRADRVIVVIEESRDFMLGYGISPDKVHVVPNYVDLDYLRACSSGAECPDGSENRFLITYIGGIGPHRGVDVAVKAMADVARRAPDALLLIIGNEGDYTDYIRRLVSKLGLERSVRLLGWQPFERVPDYLAASSVGLIPHQRNQHCDNTIPNKLFDYMAFEKPVIVSDCPPLVRITNDAQAGMVFCADRPGELAERILELRSNPELAARLGRGGAAAVQSRYNWATAAEELVKVYAILARERSPQ